MSGKHTRYHRGSTRTALAVNFLAHSALAFDDTALLAGQFAGDFVRGRDLSAFPTRVASGIRLHRRVDAFTDGHPLIAAARTGFAPPLRRHAGIVIDVVLDHLLARRWTHPAGRALTDHALWVDEALAAHARSLPQPLRRFAAWAARERMLESNVEAAAVGRTLVRLSRRSDRMAPLARAAEGIEPVIERLHEPFERFWPELERMASAWLVADVTTERSTTHG